MKIAYSFKCFNCGEISTSYNLNNYYNYDQFVYNCNNSSCDRQFWMIVVNSSGRGEFITWKEKISYRYGDSSTIEVILREYDIYYEFIFIHNNDNDFPNALFIKMHKISKTEDMISFIIRYIDNLIFC